MKLNFKDVFPLASIENADEYRETCHFYFDGQDDILKKCLDFVNSHTKKLLTENDFALQQCKLDKNYTKECCKKYAKSNDTAYRLCVDNLVIKERNIMRMYGGISIAILIGFVIFFVLRHRTISFLFNHK
jgi:hypothetical protein